MADRKDVGRFFADLSAGRRGLVVALLVLHALAALAGLVVPRILGSLVDQAAAARLPGRDRWTGWRWPWPAWSWSRRC